MSLATRSVAYLKAVWSWYWVGHLNTGTVLPPGAGYGLLRWEAGTNAGTLKLVAYSGTSTSGTTVIDNVGAGN